MEILALITGLFGIVSLFAFFTLSILFAMILWRVFRWMAVKIDQTKANAAYMNAQAKAQEERNV